MFYIFPLCVPFYTRLYYHTTPIHIYIYTPYNPYRTHYSSFHSLFHYPNRTQYTPIIPTVYNPYVTPIILVVSILFSIIPICITDRKSIPFHGEPLTCREPKLAKAGFDYDFFYRGLGFRVKGSTILGGSGGLSK